MSHQIEKRDIQTGLSQAWHGLTNIVEAITRKNSGIDYGMTTVPLIYIAGHEMRGAVKRPIYKESGAKIIISQDDGLPVGLPVGEGYSLISNAQVWDLVEKSLGDTDHKIVSVGTVNDRSIGFLSVALDKEFTAAGRVTDSVLNFTWGHGGNLSLIAKTGLTVQVCRNTINLALREHSDFKLSVKHTKNAPDRIENIGLAIQAHVGRMAQFMAEMDQLANIAITEPKAQELFAGLVTTPAMDKLSTRANGMVEKLVHSFKNGAGNRGNDLSDIFNSVTDIFSHESSGGNNPWKQYVSSEFGAGNRMKTETLEILLDDKARKETQKRGAAMLATVGQN